MNFQKQIDALHKIRIQLTDDLKEQLTDAIMDLEYEINDYDFLNDIDETNAIDTVEVVKDYLPSNYKVLICDNLNSEYDVSDFVEVNDFVRVL